MRAASTRPARKPDGTAASSPRWRYDTVTEERIGQFQQSAYVPGAGDDGTVTVCAPGSQVRGSAASGIRVTTPVAVLRSTEDTVRGWAAAA